MRSTSPRQRTVFKRVEPPSPATGSPSFSVVPSVEKRRDHKVSPSTCRLQQSPSCPIESHLQYKGATSSSRVGRSTSEVKQTTSQKRFLAAAGSKSKCKSITESCVFLENNNEASSVKQGILLSMPEPHVDTLEVNLV